MKPDRNRTITIEDLIRLKRAERPPAEFWAQFDRELRAKQLAALVAKRPWWHTLPNPFKVAFRLRLPLGAAAILGLSFLSVREYRGPSSEPQTAPIETRSVAAISDSNERGFASASQSTAGSVSNSSLPSLETAPSIVAEIEPVAADVTFSPEEKLTAPLFASLSNEALGEQAPVGTGLPMSLVSTTASPGTRLLGAKTGFESRALPARAAVEPLQQMTSPGESRRSRMLTAMVSTASMETSPRATERAASRIAEERLYDQVQRFGARGDRLNVKF